MIPVINLPLVARKLTQLAKPQLDSSPSATSSGDRSRSLRHRSTFATGPPRPFLLSLQFRGRLAEESFQLLFPMDRLPEEIQG
jgi:hypothetical protein